MLNVLLAPQCPVYTFISNIPSYIANFMNSAITSLWHDIAYAAEKGPLWLNGYIKKILKIDINYSPNWGGLLVEEENISIINDMINTIDSVMNEKRETFQAWFYRQISTLGDHAILSALLLKKEYKKLISEEKTDECPISISKEE